MPDNDQIFKPHQKLGDDPELGFLRRGRRPVIFDIVAADRETSLLPEGLKLVLHVNPRQMQLSYAKQTERLQTRGGFVEFHWGDAAESITFNAATGGFMRLWSGLSNITGGKGTRGRRETIAYDKYLDLLAAFHNNGSIYDRFGTIVTQGYVKMMFDGGIHIGWFDGQFSVQEAAEKPFLFELSTTFIIDREILRWRASSEGNFWAESARSSLTNPPMGSGGSGVTEISATQGNDQAPASSTAILDPNVDPFARSRSNPISLDLQRDEEGDVIL